MIVLAFDTSMNGCSVCVADGGRFWLKTLETERGQAEMLVPMIGEVLNESGYSYADLGRIGITTGPGSFTGLRVGLSTAKAMALSLNKPLVGFTTFDIIAKAQVFDADTLLLLDTKRGDYYGQVFNRDGAVEAARIWSIDDVAAFQGAIIRDVVPDVNILARETLQYKTVATSYDTLSAPQPVYLRGAEVSMSKRAVPTIVA